MPKRKADPKLIQQLQQHQPRPTPAHQRRIAILNVLTWRGFSTWQALVTEVERELGAGVFGKSPRSCVHSDIRALRAAGIAIGYFRGRTPGYFIRLESASEPIQRAIRQALHDLDFDHLDRIAKHPPARRLEAVFEMSTFARELSEAGKRDRKTSDES